jgi:hypothetical protein
MVKQGSAMVPNPDFLQQAGLLARPAPHVLFLVICLRKSRGICRDVMLMYQLTCVCCRRCSAV